MSIEKIKKVVPQALVVLLNVIVVIGGILFIKNRDQKASQNVAKDESASLNEQELADKAAQLQQAMQNIEQQKKETLSTTDTIVKDQPVTVTETIPGKTRTVEVPAGSSSSSSSTSTKKPATVSAPKPQATTQKS